MTALLLVRRVPPGRLELARATARRWNDRLGGGDSLQWWELVDPAAEDSQPAAALVAVHLGDPDVVRLAGVAVPPGRRDRGVQVLLALVDALRATSARTLEARAGGDGSEMLREAGFRSGADGRAVVEL